MLSPRAAALAVKDLLQCDDEEAQNHLKDFFEVMNTSSQHVTYTSGTQHGLGWCMEELYGVQCVWRERVWGGWGSSGVCGVWGEAVLAYSTTLVSGTQHGLGWCMEELYGMQCVWRERVGGALGYICGVWGEGVLAVTGCHAAVLSTAPSSVSGSPYRDWRCLARHVGLRVSNLQATSSEERLGIILEEWARMETQTVTVAKLHEVLIKSQCTRAAGCLAKGSAAHVQNTMNQEDDGILDFGDEADEFC